MGRARRKRGVTLPRASGTLCDHGCDPGDDHVDGQTWTSPFRMFGVLSEVTHARFQSGTIRVVDVRTTCVTTFAGNPTPTKLCSNEVKLQWRCAASMYPCRCTRGMHPRRWSGGDATSCDLADWKDADALRSKGDCRDSEGGGETFLDRSSRDPRGLAPHFPQALLTERRTV